MEYSIGELIDKLSTVNMKIFFGIEIVENANSSDELVARTARRNQVLNRQRADLINTINERLGQSGVIIKT